MKVKFTIAAVISVLALQTSYSQNKSNGAIATTITPTLLPPGNTEAFRFGTGLITQLDSGSAFDFLPASQWSSLGRLTTSNQTVYGLRVQRASRGLLFGYTGTPQSTTPTLGTPIIQWVGDGSTSAGDLTFRTSASSTSTVSTQVQKLRSNATALLAETSKYETGGIYSFTGGGPYSSDRDYEVPKLEINTTEREGLAVFSENNVTDFGRTGVFVNRNSTSGGVSVGSGNYGFAPLNGNSYGTVSKANNFNNGTGNGTAYGVYSEALYGVINRGVYSRTVTNSSNSLNYGYVADVNAPSAISSNYGLYATVSGSATAGSINYGVYASATGNNSFAGYFAGRIFSTNNLVVSDKSLKTDIKEEENVLEKLSRLKPVNYNFIQEKNEVNLSLSKNLQHGFIAQELEEVFPELVEDVIHPIMNEKNEQTGTKTLKSVNYIGLISMLTQSVKELKEEVDVLKEKIESNEKTYVVNNTRGFSQEEVNTIIANGYYLGQNTPNPFSTSTKIEYSLPEDDKNASILILNLNGQTLKEFKLSDPKGNISISAGTLQKGMYLYSLISNGQEIATKKMLVN